MKKEVKQKIKNIIGLVKERNKIINELKSLDEFKNKLNKVKEKYGRRRI